MVNMVPVQLQRDSQLWMELGFSSSKIVRGNVIQAPSNSLLLTQRFPLQSFSIVFMVLLQPQNLFTKKKFDVKDVGAFVGDINNDILTNWNKSCTSGTGRFVLSPGNSQLRPLTLKGPCKGGKMEVNVMGTVTAIPKNLWPRNTDTWIKFQNVTNLHIIGQGGRFDGQGLNWWNECKRAQPNTCEKINPTALAFHGCPGLFLDQVTSINSPRNHISINACNGATISNINIQAPGNSPNTDGIDISDTNGVNVNGGHIGAGDDCIAINAGSFNINITSLHCGPGHGISVGSLGRNNATESVANIKVIGVTFSDTQNGVRIKTVPGGSGSASQITFSNIGMTNVQNPIILTHFYCPHSKCDQNPKLSSVVQIKDVSFNDIHGTSTNTNGDAINIDCALNPSGCVGITLQNINIQPANPSVKVKSICLSTNVSLIPPTIPSVNCSPHPGLIEMPEDDIYDKGKQALIATS